MANWFLVRGGKEQGPYTSQQLKQAASTGQLMPDDLLRREDSKSAVASKSIQGLFSKPVPPLPSQPSGTSPPPPPSPAATSRPVAPPSAAAPAAKSNGLLKIALLVGGIGATLVFLCCGGLVIMGVVTQQSITAKVREADAKWFAGDKAAAVAEYRALAANHPVSLGDRLPTIYGRIIDFQFESGDVDLGRKTIADARSKSVVPQVESELAKQAMKSIPAIVASPGSDSAVLTANFFPVNRGKIFQTMGTIYTLNVQNRKEYEFKSESKLQITWKMNFVRSGGGDLPLPSPQVIHVRDGQEFIELGTESSITKQVRWSPIVKKGAKVGDTWECEPLPGIRQVFRLVSIEPKEVNDVAGAREHRKVPCAQIEMIETATTDQNTFVNVEEIVLGLNVGLVKRTSWRLENGERKVNWSEILSPTEKE